MKKATSSQDSTKSRLAGLWGQDWFRARDVIGPNYFVGRAFSPGLAYALVIGLFIGSGYLDGAIAAGEALFSGADYSGSYTYAGAWRSAAWMVLAVTVWVMVKHLLLASPAARPHHVTQRRDTVLAVCLYALLIFVCFGLMNGLGALLGYDPSFPYPEHPSGEYITAKVFSAAAAGFTEEVFLLALPVLLLRSARRSWTEIVVVLALLRISFHIYYGIAVAGLLPWAVIVVFMFRYTQSVWPLILAHSMTDLVASALQFGGDIGSLAILWYVVALVGVGWMLGGKVSRECELSEPLNVAASEQRLLPGGDSA